MGEGYEVENHVTGYLLLAVSGLLTICGALARYVWKRHVQENDDCKRENREDHIRIYERIDRLLNGMRK